MSRPSHIPVCRLSSVLPYTQPTCWRRAQAGIYGPLTLDARGRQQVALIEVEIAEGRTISDVQLARMLGTPSSNCVARRATQERLNRLIPPPMKIDLSFRYLGPVPDIIAGFIARRDEQWTSRLSAYFSNSKS